MKRVAFVVLFLCFVGAVPRAAPAADDTVVVGVLESLSPAQRQRLERDYGKIGGTIVRVAFHKTAEGWQAFDGHVENVEQLRAARGRFPARLDWTVAFDGRALGRVTSAAPGEWKAYADMGLELVTPGQQVVHIGKSDARFQSWEAEKPVYRPLVLVSRPNVADPDQWKTVHLGRDDLAGAIAPLRAELARERKELRFANRDIRISNAYRSRSGRIIFALTLNPKLNREDGPPGPEWSSHWFALEVRGGPVRFLGNGLALIDAGDYDGDGRSELVFAKSDYNYDGYVLYDDDLERAVEFGWSYH
jgi:hypothetical protein